MALKTSAQVPSPTAPLCNPNGTPADVWYRLFLTLIARGGGNAGVDVGALAQTIANAQFLLLEPDPGLADSLSLAVDTTLKLEIDRTKGIVTLALSVPVALSEGGTGATNAAGARQNLGLGTLATQNADDVAITGGKLEGVEVSDAAITGCAIDGSAIGVKQPAAGAFTALTNGDAVLLRVSADLPNGAAAAAATLTNAPTAGNPTKWVPFDDNGTTRYLPAW